jgi:hypothetical protein
LAPRTAARHCPASGTRWRGSARTGTRSAPAFGNASASPRAAPRRWSCTARRRAGPDRPRRQPAGAVGGARNEVVEQLTTVATDLNVGHLMRLWQFGSRGKELAKYNT